MKDLVKNGALRWRITPHRLFTLLFVSLSSQPTSKEGFWKSSKIGRAEVTAQAVLSEPGSSPGQPAKLRAATAFHPAGTQIEYVPEPSQSTLMRCVMVGSPFPSLGLDFLI